MALYADAIRAGSATFEAVASLIEGIFSAAFALVATSYTPTYGANGSMTFTGTSTEVAQYIRIGSYALVWVRVTGTTGGTANTYITITTPFTIANITRFVGNGAWVDDSTRKGAFVVPNDTTSVAVGKYDLSNYGLGASRRVAALFLMEI